MRARTTAAIVVRGLHLPPGDYRSLSPVNVLQHLLLQNCKSGKAKSIITSTHLAQQYHPPSASEVAKYRALVVESLGKHLTRHTFGGYVSPYSVKLLSPSNRLHPSARRVSRSRCRLFPTSLHVGKRCSNEGNSRRVCLPVDGRSQTARLRY